MEEELEEKLLALAYELAALKQSWQEYYSLFHHSPLPTIILTAAGQPLAHNHAYADLIGYPDAEPFRAPAAALSPPCPPEGYDSQLRSLEILGSTWRQGDRHCTWRSRKINGEEFEATVNLARVPYQGQECVQAVITDHLPHLKQLRERNQSLEANNRELQHSLAEIKTLRGLIPICLHCKRIRDDDQGYWKKLEHYLSDHLEAKLSHGICPECRDSFYAHIKQPNCWEFMRCGAEASKSCVAVVEERGHDCWRVAGTMCGGEVQGSLAKKIATCRECDFYKFVAFPVDTGPPESNK